MLEAGGTHYASSSIDSNQNSYTLDGIDRGFGNQGGGINQQPCTKWLRGQWRWRIGDTLTSAGDGLHGVHGIDFKTYFNINDESIGHHVDGKVYFSGGGGAASGMAGGLGGGGLGNNANVCNGAMPNTGGGGGKITIIGCHRVLEKVSQA